MFGKIFTSFLRSGRGARATSSPQVPAVPHSRPAPAVCPAPRPALRRKVIKEKNPKSILLYFNKEEIGVKFEIKTGSGKYDACDDCHLTVDLSSSEGVCKTDLLCNPGEVNFKFYSCTVVQLYS